MKMEIGKPKITNFRIFFAKLSPLLFWSLFAFELKADEPESLYERADFVAIIRNVEGRVDDDEILVKGKVLEILKGSGVAVVDIRQSLINTREYVGVLNGLYLVYLIGSDKEYVPDSSKFAVVTLDYTLSEREDISKVLQRLGLKKDKVYLDGEKLFFPKSCLLGKGSSMCLEQNKYLRSSLSLVGADET